jgi:hypothetical protein
MRLLITTPVAVIVDEHNVMAIRAADESGGFGILTGHADFSNERVSEADVLSGHFASTQERLAATNGLVLMLHDTTEFTFKRDKPDLIGITKTVNKKGKTGWLTPHTLCGILMHSSLAVTTEGVPLGLAAVRRRMDCCLPALAAWPAARPRRRIGRWRAHLGGRPAL